MRPGGALFVLEPVFYPALTMSLVFYVKRAVTTITTRRVQLFDRWNNLGAPVVSYYTNEELRRMTEADPRSELLAVRSVPGRITALQRAALIYRREDTTLVLLRRERDDISSRGLRPSPPTGTALGQA